MSKSDSASAGETSLDGLLRHFSPLALFLDFDGVLVDIAPTPDAVKLDGALISRLQSLNSALNGALAIVSGRQIADLDAHLAPLSLAIAGDHGNSRRNGGGETTIANEHAGSSAGALFSTLSAQFASDSRILVESKPSAVAVHYRLAPERAEECIAAVKAAVGPDSDLSIIAGKMVIEARAKGVSKGTALRHYMAEQPFDGRTPIFVGDDVTDEDGFAAAQDLGGIGIKVGDGDTVAKYRIEGTRDVARVLDAIIKVESGMG